MLMNSHRTDRIEPCGSGESKAYLLLEAECPLARQRQGVDCVLVIF